MDAPRALAEEPVPVPEDAEEEQRIAKRVRWINYQLADYPLPAEYLLEWNCAASLLDLNLSKRTWEKQSKRWLDRRRAAYAQFVENTE